MVETSFHPADRAAEETPHRSLNECRRLASSIRAARLTVLVDALNRDEATVSPGDLNVIDAEEVMGRGRHEFHARTPTA